MAVIVNVSCRLMRLCPSLTCLLKLRAHGGEGSLVFRLVVTERLPCRVADIACLLSVLCEGWFLSQKLCGGDWWEDKS